MYRTTFAVTKYGHKTIIRFDYDYKIGKEEIMEIDLMLMRLFDCDPIHIIITEQNVLIN